MYKVVIVDDEPIILEGLTKGVKWEQWNCEVVGTAYNGVEGLEIIRSMQPDILLSDINMPNMDGLAMIAAIKSEFKGIEVCILTGYRDFDYAQQAIKLGVTRFLLKPSKIDEIKEAITTMIRKIEERRKQECEYKAMLENEELKNEGGKEEKATEKEEEDDTSEASNFIVKNALEYIETHYNSKLKLSDVADKIYVSQWHLSKLLNRLTGQNFSEILNSVRIEKAKELLADPSLRIGDVADAVGFMDMAHFSRVFKKIEGVSANEYRNKNLG